MKPKALDLFCKAGGASMGLHRAGFDVTGVDIEPQPRYPFAFIQADALEIPLGGYDFIWASPPCHRYSQGTAWRRNLGVEYPDLIDKIRERLLESGIPFCIENVPGARAWLRSPFRLCGAMFGLNVIRHRLFESSVFVMEPPHVCHDRAFDADLYTITRHGPPARWYARWSGTGKPHFCIKLWHQAMGIDWMRRDELTQAIPPAYSEYIGRFALQAIRNTPAEQPQDMVSVGRDPEPCEPRQQETWK